MKQIKNKFNSILWNEALGFSSMIVLSWASEIFHIPHLIFNEPFAPNWHRALLRTAVILLIWAWVHWITQRLLKRLHHLEEYLRICGWCRKVCHNNEWLTTEAYFNSKFATHTTCGMCPDCAEKVNRELMQNENPFSTPGQ